MVRVLADLAELAQDLGHVHCANRRASNQRLLDHRSARLIIEIGEKSRGIEDRGCVFQSARRCLSLSFRPAFGDQLIGKGSGPCPRAVEPSRLSHGETWARKTQRAVWLHRDKKLVAFAEAQLLADLGGKHQASAVPELNAKRFGVGHSGDYTTRPLISHIMCGAGNSGRLMRMAT